MYRVSPAASSQTQPAGDRRAGYFRAKHNRDIVLCLKPGFQLHQLFDKVGRELSFFVRQPAQRRGFLPAATFTNCVALRFNLISFEWMTNSFVPKCRMPLRICQPTSGF